MFYDSDLFLLTTAVDQRYRLNFFHANLKQKVLWLLKSEVEYHKSRETGHSYQVPLVPPKKPKAQLHKNDVPKTFCRSFLHLNQKQVQTLTKVSNNTQLTKRFR